MKQIGGLMAFLGIGSFVLNMLGREFSLLMWIDSWGPTVGTIIRVGLVVVGAGLFFIGSKQETQASDT